MTILSHIEQLSRFADHQNPQIAEYAQTMKNYAQAAAAGKLSQEEYQSLIGDVSLLQRMARTADEQQQVADIHAISRMILSFL